MAVSDTRCQNLKSGFQNLWAYSFSFAKRSTHSALNRSFHICKTSPWHITILHSKIYKLFWTSIHSWKLLLFIITIGISLVVYKNIQNWNSNRYAPHSKYIRAISHLTMSEKKKHGQFSTANKTKSLHNRLSKLLYQINLIKRMNQNKLQLFKWIQCNSKRKITLPASI